MKLLESVTPVVLAGGSSSSFLSKFGVDHPGELVFHGERLLDRTIRIVREAAPSQPIIVIGRMPENSAGCQHIPDQGALWQNVCAGLAAAKTDAILTVAADIPLLNGKVFTELTSRIEQTEERLRKPLDFCYTIAEEIACEAVMPGVARTAMRFRGNSYTGGNIMKISRRILEIEELAQEVTESRKSKKELVAAILRHVDRRGKRRELIMRHGWTILLLALGKGTKYLSLKQARGVVSCAADVHCDFVIVPAKTACDIDTPEHWERFTELFPAHASV